MCDGSVSASVFFWHLCKLESKISRVPSADGTGPVPADPQAGVRALDLARTLLPAQRRNRAPRAEQHEQPLQALDAERREQWLWSDGRTARWAHERAHEKALLGADLLPQPRDEDDVRVEAQWQEHVCTVGLTS